MIGNKKKKAKKIKKNKTLIINNQKGVLHYIFWNS